MTSKSTKSLWLKLFLSTSLLGVVLFFVRPSDILETLKKINSFYLLIVIALYLGVYLVLTINAFILYSTHSKIPFSIFARIYFMVFTVSEYTPGKIGDFSLALFLKKYDAKPASITFLVLLDKLINLCGWTIFFFISLYFTFDYIDLNPLSLSINELLLIFFASFTLLFLIVVMIFKKKFAFILTKVLGFIKTKYQIVIINFLLTMLKIAMYFFTIYFTFQAFSIDVPYIFIVLATSLVSILGVLPISINSIGLREAVFSLIFPQVGIAAASAIAVSLSIPIFSAIVKGILIGFYILFAIFLGIPYKIKDLKKIS